MAGNDSFTKLLLHCNGVDASTSFPDDSASSHTVVANADAQVDTAIKKFGSGSALFDGAGDFLSSVDSSDWDFGTADFTIDFWFYRNGTQNPFSSLVSTMPSSGSGWAVMVGKSGDANKIAFVSTASGGLAFDFSGNGVIPDQTLTHIAVVRHGNNLKVYINGLEDQTRDVTGYNYTNSTDELIIGRYYTDVNNYYANGNMDEIRVSKGIARWTSNFTPPTSPYSAGESTEINETVTLDDSWQVQTNPAIAALDDTILLDDIWQVQTNPAIIDIDETITFDDAWVIATIEKADYISKILSINPLIFVTNTNPAKLFKVDITDPENPITTGVELVGVQGAKSVSYNATTGFLYVACESGKVVKVDFTDLSIQTIIDLSDTDNLETIDNFDDESITFISTDSTLGELYMLDERSTMILDTNFQYLQENETQLDTDFKWINALLLDTNFQFLQTNETQINTDFKWLTNTITDIDPVGRDDFVVKIGGTTLTGDDLVSDSITIVHTIGEENEATFRVARYHDNLNTTLNGASIPITSQNSVQVIINGITEFTGNISNLNCVFEINDEYIEITAKGTQQTESRQNVTLSLPSNSQQLSLYDVLLQNPQINNPMIDPNDEEPEFFLGIKVDLGTEIVQSISRFQYFGSTQSLAENVTDGSFQPKQNWSYFWFGAARNFITGAIFATLRYLGTSIGSLTGDTWEIDRLSWKRQRTFDDNETDLGEYTVGSAPFQDVSTKNGILIPADKWTDKPDGLYREKDAGTNFEDYAKRVANLEFDKLTTINGTILPKTSVSINLTIDAYYYYALKLLTRINIDNTTQSGIFKNSQGFPVSIKAITISSGTMGVTLTTDNSKSIVELEEIDDQYPDENSDEFNSPTESVKNFTKFDPNTLTTIE